MSRTSSAIRIVCFAGILFVGASPGRGQEDGVVLEVLKARLESIQNVSVEYDLSEEFFPPEKLQENPVIDLGDGVRIVAKVKPKKGRALFRFLYGKARFEWALDEGMLSGARNSDRKKSVHIHSGSRVDRLTIDVSGSQHGMIDDDSPLPGNIVVDVAIGLRPFGAADWFEPDSLDGIELTPQNDGTVKLESPDASISSRRHVWSFDPEQDYALVRYQVFSSDRLYLDVENSEFETVQNVKLPRTITWTQYRFDDEGNAVENMRKVATVQRYVLGDPDNTPESYVMVWPVNTAVLDERTDTAVVVTSGERMLDDEWLKEAANRYSRDIVGSESDVPQPPKAAWPRRWLLTANLVCIAALIVFLCYRRVRNGAES